ncbi:MAG: LuxE/PaaK family acyltransferase [Flavisolibacter sp.]
MHVEIPKADELEEKVFHIDNEKDFLSIALDIYHFQFANNPIYRDYCKALNKQPELVSDLSDIPFLPISFFKSHRVATTSFEPEMVFKSSGTTGMLSSSHFVKSRKLYERSFMECFGKFYGKAEDYCIVGLLPSYLEKGQSSLVYMVDHLIKRSGNTDSGFYLYDYEKLHKLLVRLEEAGQKTMLIGVTYALLDYAAQYPQNLQHTILMETGGMKGRQKEITRKELFERLRASFGLKAIHSEYGMTELLSQAYAVDGNFKTPPWMKLLLRDETDPFEIYETASETSVSGVINVIDLANMYSCSFIATEDAGRYTENTGFEVLGRMDHTDVRGCSLMVM